MPLRRQGADRRACRFVQRRAITDMALAAGRPGVTHLYVPPKDVVFPFPFGFGLSYTQFQFEWFDGVV